MPIPPPTRTTPSTILTPGELLLGRYQVLRHVASGGMGQVFEALDLELEQRIALKTLHPRIADNTEALERFKREIRLARRVTHPNVCRLFDFGSYRTVRGEEEREVLFLTMELLEGESLASYVSRRGRLPLTEVATIVAQVALGLEAAHEQGIIHRDLNSRNIHLVMASNGLRAVITDFGLARQITSTSGSTLTLGGDLLGTPAYMAPEQLEGGEVSPATDIYAFGVVIYEMLTGRLPFEGDTPISVAMQHLRNAPPSPLELVPDLDPRWEAIALRCLEKRPGRRFASAALLRDAALDPNAKASSILGRKSSWPAVAAAALLIAAAVGLIALTRGAPAADPATALAAAIQLPETAHDAEAAATPTDPEAARWYGEGLEQLRGYRHRAARDAFERAIAADPRFPRSYAWLAEVQTCLGNPKGAREASRKALTLATQLSREDELLIKTVYNDIHDAKDAALEAGRELVALVPASTDYALLLANLLLERSDVDAAALLLTELRKRPPPAGDDPRIGLFEAKVAFQRSDFAGWRAAAERTAAAAQASGRPALEARARLVLSDALMHVDGPASSLEQAMRARALFVETGEHGGEATSLLTEGLVLTNQGDTTRAAECFERALEIFRSLGNQGGIAASLNRLGNVEWLTGDSEAARAHYREAIEIFRQNGDQPSLVRADYNLGLALMALHELEAARTSLERSLAYWRENNQRAGEATALNSLGVLAQWTGNLAEATLRFSEATAIHESLGDRAGGIVPLSNLARSSLRLGDLAQATEQLERARRFMEQTGDERAGRGILGGLAQLALIQDRLDDAEALISQMGRPEMVATISDEILEGWVLPAALSLARGRYEAAAESARTIVAAAQATGTAALESWGRIKLVAALHGQGKLAEAEAELSQVPEQPTSGPNPEIELERRLWQAELQAAGGDVEAARENLKELLSISEKGGFYEVELEARLGLCALEPNADSVRACFSALEAEAEKQGFRRLARVAAERRARLKAS